MNGCPVVLDGPALITTTPTLPQGSLGTADSLPRRGGSLGRPGDSVNCDELEVRTGLATSLVELVSTLFALTDGLRRSNLAEKDLPVGLSPPDPEERKGGGGVCCAVDALSPCLRKDKGAMVTVVMLTLHDVDMIYSGDTRLVPPMLTRSVNGRICPSISTSSSDRGCNDGIKTAATQK
jgi:hypothetical protein